MSAGGQDVRYGLRLLRKSPGFTAVAALALALGIGANTAIFSVVHTVLLRDLPFRDPDRLVAIWERNDAYRLDRSYVSPANLVEWQASNRVFESIAALENTQFNLTGGPGGWIEPEELHAQRVTSNLLPLLGVEPVLGRGFLPEEVQPGKSNAVLLSSRLWRRRFGEDPAILGRAIRLNGAPWTVVGVLPPGFELLNPHADLWVPLVLRQTDVYRTTGARTLIALARMRHGVPLAEARAEMRTIARRLESAFPKMNAGWTVNLLSLKDEVVGDHRTALIALLCAAAALLMIACTNVANLLLARSAARQKEIALRVALGAGRTRIMRQLLTEGVLLALLAGALGLVLALGGLRAVKAFGPESISGLDRAGLDLPVLGFTLLVSALTGVAFALAPALEASRPDLSAALKECGRGNAAGVMSVRLRGVLVVTEIALAVVLLIGAGLMVRSFLRLTAVDPGLDPRRLLTLRLTLASGPGASEPERVEFFRRALASVRALPGVLETGAVSLLPLAGFGNGAAFRVAGRTAAGAAYTPIALVRAIDPNYFTAMRIPLLRGRAFTDHDTADTARVAIASEALARRHFGRPEAAIGGKLVIEFRETVTVEVVGVAADVPAEGLHARPWPTIYCPHPQAAGRNMTLVVRTAGPPERMAAAVAAEIHRLRAEQPVAEVRSMERVLGESVAAQRFQMLLLGVFAAAALLLASIGIYGIIAYDVTERTREIGIRMALGAGRGEIFRMVLARAGVLVGAGVVFGLAGALAVTRLMASLLYGVTATDAVTFTGVCLLLCASALAAAYIPAWRATRLDPTIALRHE